MKKIFLAALVALAFSSYSYAQDDMYEEDSPRAAAPAAPSYSEPAKSVRSEGGDAFMGISLDLLGMLNNDVQRFGLVFKLAPDMELTGIIGLQIYGDVDGEDNEGKKVEGAEGGARISLGAGFDFFFETGILPISIGGDLIFTHLGEDNNELDSISCSVCVQKSSKTSASTANSVLTQTIIGGQKEMLTGLKSTSVLQPALTSLGSSCNTIFKGHKKSLSNQAFFISKIQLSNF